MRSGYCRGTSVIAALMRTALMRTAHQCGWHALLFMCMLSVCSRRTLVCAQRVRECIYGLHTLRDDGHHTYNGYVKAARRRTSVGADFEQRRRHAARGC